MMACCSKVICNGCHHANKMREAERRLIESCPFCREPTPSTVEASDKQRMKRIEANDPVAMCREGLEQYNKGDYRSALKYWAKAAELGNVTAHCQLAGLYHHVHGVEKDKQKEIHHLEEAAIGGHPDARKKLGYLEGHNYRYERAVKHLIIAANQGSDESIKFLLQRFRNGIVSKEDLDTALRAHQAAVDATKSPQREAAEEYYRNRRCR